MPTRTASRKTQTTKSEAPKSESTYGERENGYLSGNLTQDFELRFTQTGRAVANSSVAVNERVQNPKTREWEDTDPEFYKITVWGDQAEHAVECFAKGDRIVAVGFFQDRTYVNSNDEERTVTEFTARDIGPSLLFRDAEIKRPQRSKR